MQAVVIPRAVPKQEWRELRLTGTVTDFQIGCVILWKPCRDIQACIPFICDRGERGIDLGPQLRDNFRQWVGQVFVLPLTVSMMFHNNPAAKPVRIVIERG